MKQYMTCNAIAEEFGLTPDTIRKWVREMRKENRYDPETTFFGGERSVLVRTVCLLDYSKYRDTMRSPSMRKYLPEFDALAIERKIGIVNEIYGN